ncbi:MAG: CapA family protein [Chloroflexi bacterium]|nr:CapA family protein [Chloroflexota bacterium]
MDDKAIMYSCGDVILERVERGLEPESFFRLVQPTLKEADIRTCQLEQALSRKGRLQGARWSAQVPRMDPRNVTGLTFAGFDVITCATNCNMDWGEEALLDTLDLLKSHGMKPVGAGKNLAEARQPAIIEKNGVKVAFLAYCTLLPPGFAAEEDKAGDAPIKVHTFYEPGEWQPGAPAKVFTYPYDEDVAAMQDDIAKAKAQADVVAVSLHWGIHFMPKAIAMYQPPVGHAAIDAGADIIIGTHAHLLKGIEVYKGKAIFYSLGNFATDNDPQILDTPRGREMTKLYKRVIDPEYPTFVYPLESRMSMIVKTVLTKQGVEKVSFLPLYITKPNQPEVMPKDDPRFAEVIKHMQWTSEDFGTKFVVEGKEVVVQGCGA